MERFSNSKVIFKALIFSFILLSCSDYDKFEPYTTHGGSFHFLSALQAEQEVVDVYSSQSHSLITADSILLEIPSDAFLDEYGREYTDNARVVFSFAQKKHHLLGHGISLVQEDNQLIRPLGIIRVDAYSESGHPLSLRPGKLLKVKIPGINETETPTIYQAVYDSFQGEKLNRWTSLDNVSTSSIVKKENWIWKTKEGFIRHSEGWVLYAGTLDWLVLGYKIENAMEKKVEVSLEKSVEPENTRIFLLDINQKNCQILEFNQERHTFCNSSNRITNAFDALLISITQLENDSILMDFHSMKQQSEEIIYLQPKAYPASEAYQLLENL